MLAQVSSNIICNFLELKSTSTTKGWDHSWLAAAVEEQDDERRRPIGTHCKGGNITMSLKKLLCSFIIIMMMPEMAIIVGYNSW